MNMAWYDWLLLETVPTGCKKFVRSSADFLAASRLGDAGLGDDPGRQAVIRFPGLAP